jgi:Ca-activated chloride channel family protein
MTGNPLKSNPNGNKVSTKINILVLLAGLIFANQALGAVNPDELYRQGRFEEAEQAYAQSDMDNPKDIRYRYNRGCAAYQDSDYKGAKATFSSVLKRVKDDEIRFKASYNLGNTAYKDGDFASAAEYFKQSLAYNPASEDARHNLELTLRELEKQKNKESEDSKSGQKKPSDSQEDKEGNSDTGKKEDDSSGKDAENKQSGDKEQEADKGQTESSREKKQEQQKPEDLKGTQKEDRESPTDLSGELKPLNAPEEAKDEEGSDSYASVLDKKKAEALLDNMKEDRSRFLRFQIPEDKRHGVQSGKDW